MDYPSFVRRQWQALVDEWLAPINVAYIALPDLGWLDKLQQLQWPGGGGNWSPLGSVPIADARVRRDAAGLRQLWVRPEEKSSGTGRYAAYWAEFVRQQGVTGAPGPVGGRAMAVDHLFPETAAARRGFVLVRAVPVDARSNSLLGSTTEKVEAGRPGAQRPRTATALTMAKVTGFQGSFSRGNAAGAAGLALLNHLRSCGLNVPAGALLPGDEEADLIAWLIGTYRR